MPDHRAFVTAPFRGLGLDRLTELAEVVLDPWIDGENMRIYQPGELAERLQREEADIVICESDPCEGPVLDLPLVAIGATRGDPTNVDVESATAKGIPVLHAPGRNADAVAELTVGLLLAAVRRITAADRDVHEGEIYRDGTIPYQRFRGVEIAGKTAGIVGFGAVGRATAWRLKGLGMEVIASDPFADDATHTLEEVLEQADVVSLHAVLNDDTEKMIGADEFEHMRDGAVFVNTARAGLHDWDALVEALDSGHLGAAALDHFPDEWLDADHPLTAFPNVVLTPHIGGATTDTEANHSRMIAEDLARLLAGETPQHCANPEVLK